MRYPANKRSRLSFSVWYTRETDGGNKRLVHRNENMNVLRFPGRGRLCYCNIPNPRAGSIRSQFSRDSFTERPPEVVGRDGDALRGVIHGSPSRHGTTPQCLHGACSEHHPRKQQ